MLQCPSGNIWKSLNHSKKQKSNDDLYVFKYIYIHALVMISLPQVHTADFDDHQELPQVKDLGKNCLRLNSR